MNEINPFPPLIFKEKFGDFDHTHIIAASEILDQSISIGNSYLEKKNAFSSIGNQTNPPHLHPVFSSFFSWLQQRAENILHHQYNLSDRYSYYIGNSWVNLHRFNGQTIEHNHGLSALSCVAYLTMPNDSGYTEFKDPYYNLRSLHEQNDSHLKEWFPIIVEPGDVLFFPGWLLHRSQTSNSYNDRWVLSANFINFLPAHIIKIGEVVNLASHK